MNLYVSGIIVFAFLYSAVAKPGEPYVLTGREKSIFSIFQRDTKAYPELYKDEDINEYYKEFKTLNNLSERKLKRGEELMFPHTRKSKKIQEDEMAQAARAAARARAKEAAATNPKEPEKQLSLFESDSPSQPKDINPEAERERAEARRKITRQKSVSYFQRTVLPRWMRNQSSEIFGEGNIDGLVAIAQEKVDEDFAESLVLHRYPAKNIYILEFEKPQKVGEYFFVAIKTEERGEPHFYSLEKGISFFGTGDVSVLFEWRSGESISNLGGRKYKDLPRFLQEIETGRPLHSDSD